MKEKQLKVYTLYKSMHGYTAQSKWYAVITKKITHTAAYSLKQAAYLTDKEIWVGESGPAGIIEHSIDMHEEWKWIDKDGEELLHPRVKHGQKLEPWSFK